MNKPAGKIAIFALILAMAAVPFGDFLLFAAGVGVENSSNQPDASYGSGVSDLSYKPDPIRTSSNGVNMSETLSLACNNSLPITEMQFLEYTPHNG